MVGRIVTGAHYGLSSWLVQRISAAVLAVYALFLGGWLFAHPAPGYDAWAALFSGRLMRSVTLLAWLALISHAWVGVRDIVMDYIKPAGARLAAHAVVILALIGYAIWAVQILWGAR